MTARAQQASDNTLILNDRQIVYAAAPYTYHTRDQGGELSAREIFLRHSNNLRGNRLTDAPIDLSYDTAAHWLLLDIRNDSHRSDWILDMGTLVQGRTGLPARFFIQNANRGTMIVNGLQSDRFGFSSAKPVNHQIPLELLPGQSMTLLIYTVPNDHAPYIITPRILTSNMLLDGSDMQSDTGFKNGILALMTGCCIFFIGTLMTRRGLAFFPHILFFGTQIFWFWLSGNHVFAGIPGSADMQGIAMSVGALCALAATQSIVISQEGDESDSIILYICASLVLVGIILFAFLLPDGSPLRMGFATGLPAMGYAMAAIKALTIRNDLRWAGLATGLAWIAMLAGQALPYIDRLSAMPPSLSFIEAPWLAMPLVCALLVLSGAAYIRAGNVALVREVLRQTQRAQRESRLKQSKESADQARLLRVIEREREIMNDLRGREAERTEEMRLAKISADEANQAKSAFLAVVSHEIRTPMTGIMGMVRLLLDTHLSTEQRDYTQTIQDSGDAMLALLNDILDFSKIESGGMDIESIDFDLHRVVKSVSMLMNGHATQRGIYLHTEIDIDAPRYLKGDPTRIRQILLNLVGNAIKFTTRGGVTIRLLTGNPDLATGDRMDHIPLMIEVEDTGIGISEEAQKNLFHPFSQADSSIARKFGGTGLGLAICKRLIEAMDGEIGLNSTEGQGTIFRIGLLLSPGDQQKAEDATHAEHAATGNIAAPMTILVVDDNAINRKVMEGLLGRDGHTVTSAGSGQEALDILQDRSFDLIFMDIEMPDMGGIEVTAQIRTAENPAIASIPVIALTGNVAEEDRARYLDAGMQDTLPKPIDSENLRRLLIAFGTPKLGNSFGVASQKPPVSWALSDEDLAGDSFSESIDEDPVSTTEESSKDAGEEFLRTEAHFNPNLLDGAVFGALVNSLEKTQIDEMLDGVFQHNRTVLPTLQHAFNDDDRETLRNCAHELKGMNANFGLKAIAAAAMAIEKGCSSGELSYSRMEDLIFNELPAAMDETESLFKKQG